MSSDDPLPPCPDCPGLGSRDPGCCREAIPSDKDMDEDETPTPIVMGTAVPYPVSGLGMILSQMTPIIGECVKDPKKVEEILDRLLARLRPAAPTVDVEAVEGGYILRVDVMTSASPLQHELMDVCLRNMGPVLADGFNKDVHKRAVEELIEVISRHHESGELMRRPETRTRVVTSTEELGAAIAAMLLEASGEE